MDKLLIHAYPTWEQHDTEHGRDCWCEPTVKDGGAVIVHYARTCKEPFRVHHWVWRPDPERPRMERMECIHCGQQRAHVAQGYVWEKDS